MILTDGVHLVSDHSLNELHKFARRIGLKPEWFQDGLPGVDGPGAEVHPHYDLTTARMAAKAERLGASRVDTRKLLRRMVRG